MVPRYFASSRGVTTTILSISISSCTLMATR